MPIIEYDSPRIAKRNRSLCKRKKTKINDI